MTELNEFQKEQLEVYKQRGLDLGLYSGPTDRSAAEETMKEAYKCAGYDWPGIVFWSESPKAMVALYEEVTRWTNAYRDQKGWKTEQEMLEELFPDRDGNIDFEEVKDRAKIDPASPSTDGIHQCAYGSMDAHWINAYEYCWRILDVDIPQIEGLTKVMQTCGWYIPCDSAIFMSDLPTELHTAVNDNDIHVLHKEGGPSIRYSDGFCAYNYMGVNLPEKYGKLHPSEWETQWVMTEENAELRRVLIQGITYERIVEELDAEELDSWREYSLLKMKNSPDEEDMLLVKMTCPSTGMIHVHRVPPDTKTAREGITWNNWGTDPEDFSVEA